MARVVEGLKGHARSGRAVSDDRDATALPALSAKPLADAEARRDRSARVSRAKNVVFTLAAAQKSARSVGLLDLDELLAAACQRLVAVGLVADVPDQAVSGSIKYPMKSNG